jgi:hypothetical protein
MARNDKASKQIELISKLLSKEDLGVDKKEARAKKPGSSRVKGTKFGKTEHDIQSAKSQVRKEAKRATKAAKASKKARERAAEAAYKAAMKKDRNS